MPYFSSKLQVNDPSITFTVQVSRIQGKVTACSFAIGLSMGRFEYDIVDMKRTVIV